MVTEDTTALDALDKGMWMKQRIARNLAKQEAYNATLHGNTSSVKMKKYAMNGKIAELKAQLDQASTLLAKLEASIERDNG